MPMTRGISLAVFATGGFALTVTGSGFIASSVVRWNGEDRPTTFQNSSTLLATLADADVLGVSMAQVTV